jgi:two-component system sensor histidine kinase KdpD
MRAVGSFPVLLEARRSMIDSRAGVAEYLRAIGLVAATTLLCYVLRPHIQTTDVAMLYLLIVVAVAARYRQGAALVTTVLSIAAFDFLFVPPYYTFNVHNAAYFLTFGVMLVVALLMSRLTAQLREQAEEAREREHRTGTLYAMEQELTEAGDRQRQIAIATRHLGLVVGGEAVLYQVDDSGSAGEPDWPTEGMFESLAVRVAARWSYQHGETAGLGTAHCAEAEALVVPLRTATRRVGIAVARPDPPRVVTRAELLTIQALADQVATTLERTLLVEDHEQARLETESERLRTALLSSLSHDLRTPLASIEGAASSLLHAPEDLSTEIRRELADTVLEESRRMSRLVANLLDMVRVETGGLTVKKTWQPLEEALGVALLRLEDRLRSHPVRTQLPHDLPLVPIDELLIEQVFINLLENAAKHTPAETPIAVSAWRDDGAVIVEVTDRGAGIPVGMEEAIFQKFHRAPSADHSTGAGLGLTICRGIVAAHGGRIWVKPRQGGGAAFQFSLPLEGPPVMPLPPDLPD